MSFNLMEILMSVHLSKEQKVEMDHIIGLVRGRCIQDNGLEVFHMEKVNI